MKYQIYSPAKGYMSVSINTGLPVWYRSPDMGYMYDLEDARVVVQQLLSFGHIEGGLYLREYKTERFIEQNQ